jgi:hypothetical protein
MKVRIIKQGDKAFAYDGEDEASLRQALLHDATGIPGGDVYDITDLDRFDMDADEYLIATEDDGTPVWSGWLGGVTGPPPVDRDALAGIVAEWERCAENAHGNHVNGDVLAGEEARVLRGCAAHLRDAIGGDR